MTRQEKLKLSAPWEQVHHKIKAFFEGDKEVTIDEEGINYDDMTLKINVTNPEKYRALARRLKKEYDFGTNKPLRILIDYNPDGARQYDPVIDVQTIMKGNPLFSELKTVQDPITGMNYHFCIFKKQVVQYFDDMFNDLHGLRSTLAQDIALDIFEDTQVMYSTSNK